MRFTDLFENFARISMMESSDFLLDTSKDISTSFDETIKLVELGKLSSGKAELKFQSSSAEAPFTFWPAGIDGVATLVF